MTSGVSSTNTGVPAEATEVNTQLGFDLSFDATQVPARTEKYVLGYSAGGVFIESKKVKKSEYKEINDVSLAIHHAILKDDEAASDFEIKLGSMIVTYMSGAGEKKSIDLGGADPFFEKHTELKSMPGRLRVISKRLWGTRVNPNYSSPGKNHALLGSRTQIDLLPKTLNKVPKTLNKFCSKPLFGKSHFTRLYETLDKEQEKTAVERLAVAASYLQIFSGKIRTLVEDQQNLTPKSDREKEAMDFDLGELRKFQHQLEKLEQFQLFWAAAMMPSYDVKEGSREDLLAAARQVAEKQQKVLREQFAKAGLSEETMRHFSIETGGILLQNRCDKVGIRADAEMAPGGPSIEGFIARQLMTLEAKDKAVDFSSLDTHFKGDIEHKIQKCLAETADEVNVKRQVITSKSLTMDELAKHPQFSSLF